LPSAAPAPPRGFCLAQRVGFLSRLLRPSKGLIGHNGTRFGQLQSSCFQERRKPFSAGSLGIPLLLSLACAVLLDRESRLSTLRKIFRLLGPRLCCCGSLGQRRDRNP
jgi:hypothetical protein